MSRRPRPGTDRPVKTGQRVRPILRLAANLLLAASALCAAAADAAGAGLEAGEAALPLRTNDVVAFFGGAGVAARADGGRLDALLAVAAPGRRIRLRSLAWEGDTVLRQPREVNFPRPAEELAKCGATVAVLEFGQAEALAGIPTADFAAALARMAETMAAGAHRVVLVIPPAFEEQAPPRPNPAVRNDALRDYAGAIRSLAAAKGYGLIDLLGALPAAPAGSPRLTDDGWHLSPAGDAAAARLIATALAGAPAPAPAVKDRGEFTAPALESLRKEAAAKNALWHYYSRPMNWAFLGGDRTEQPSSRDHLNPQHRWFPEEMEKFPPLISAAEGRMEELARAASSAAVR